jgi:hypothetical protein
LANFLGIMIHRGPHTLSTHQFLNNKLKSWKKTFVEVLSCSSIQSYLTSHPHFRASSARRHGASLRLLWKLSILSLDLVSSLERLTKRVKQRSTIHGKCSRPWITIDMGRLRLLLLW